jgi:hypothetical protein
MTMPTPDNPIQQAQDGADCAGRSEGGHPTHWLVPLLYEAAERIRVDADDLKAAHAPDGNWAGEELAEVEHDRDIRLSARLILAATRLERGEV